MPRSAATTTSTDLVYLELTTSEGSLLADALDEAASHYEQVNHTTARYLSLVARRIRGLGTNNASQNGSGH